MLNAQALASLSAEMKQQLDTLASLSPEALQADRRDKYVAMGAASLS